MTWLLVEDDNDIRNVVAVMMSVWGEKPLPFPDGGSAWRWLDSVANGTYSGELPELALMDIRMPGYTGDKVAVRIRQIEKLKDIPVILMTAFSLSADEIKDMMETCGVDHLINKPLPDMEVFRSTLYRVRDEKRKRVAAQAAESKPAASASPAAPVTEAVPAAPGTPAAPGGSTVPNNSSATPPSGTAPEPINQPTANNTKNG